MKWALLVLSFVFLAFVQAQDTLTANREAAVKTKTLNIVAEEYTELLNRIGHNIVTVENSDILAICTPDLKKVVNGAVWFQGAENFLPQLRATSAGLGIWSLELKEILVSKDERTVVLRHIVHTVNGPLWTAMAILRCNQDLMIYEIDEIFTDYSESVG